ncbi:MAG: 4Fe-4S dicluster domain-containing protein [Candidatus Cloacimonetes bacterium]|nr:4Fe-4S dicluster domain-containing protein [Candidatus Cloacimonadota bacterium]
MIVFLEDELSSELKRLGADFVYFVNISQLSEIENKGFPAAVLLGIILTPEFIRKVTDNPDFVKQMVQNNRFDEDEFGTIEAEADRLADHLAGYLIRKGYSTYSQSENNINATGYYDQKNFLTPLPHKTIAGLAGLGWIGKHNLLVNPEFGSAFCMCTVLTNAPLKTVLFSPQESQCGDCEICKDICPVAAIKGNSWYFDTHRDDLVNVHKCITCLRCMALCPWTQAYMEG